ncbi:MAG: nitroreductase family deazaflavin-dependent oxidoreductase [Candidatus Dormibacteraeota bacterium]|nr:nitroreductase family deazaflavin-dependent oxidoreductase [Candidatus Dormibacteraeota bacterium]
MSELYRTDPLAANRQMVDDFRAARDRGEPLNRPMLLLTTTGARSGEPRTAPMMYVPDGDRLLVIGSNMGAAQVPAWVHNIRARTDVTVEVRAETALASAREATGAERDQLFADIAAQHPFFLDHQAGISRPIPVVVLTRRDGQSFAFPPQP